MDTTLAGGQLLIRKIKNVKLIAIVFQKAVARRCRYLNYDVRSISIK